MPSRREPLFLGRETYRRRRLIDAMRLLPVLGAFCFLVPLLGSGSGAARSTALAGLYLFAAWLALIGAAAALVRFLAAAPAGVGSDPTEPEPAPVADSPGAAGDGAP